MAASDEHNPVPYIPHLSSQPNPINVYHLDMQAMPMVRSMMRTGILVDTGHLLKLGRRIDREMRELSHQVHELASREFNIASDDQVREVLFEDLKLDYSNIRRTKKLKLVSTQKDELEKIVSQHAIVRLIMDWQHRAHLKSSFVEKLPKFLDHQSRAHADIMGTRVETGRYAVKEPPLQQIPVKSEIGKEVRKAFIARDGCKLAAADYSQIEMRVAAHESGDVNLSQVFWDDDDIHWRTAEAALLRDRSQISSEERSSFKNVGFGVLYGVQAQGLMNQMISKGGDPQWWTIERCQAYIDGWFAAYPLVWKWMQEQFRRARQFGGTWCCWGRFRDTPQVYSVHSWIEAGGLRAAGNHPIQAGAVGISKRAMAEDAVMGLLRTFDEGGIWCKPLLQIHDELLIEVDERVADEVAGMMADTMAKVVKLDVPVKCDWKVGASWGHLK